MLGDGSAPGEHGARSRPAPAWLAAYGALYALGAPFLLPLLALHPRLRGGFLDRLGGRRVPHAPRPAERPVWFHGASAGDVRALSALVRELEAQGWPTLVSAGTRAGHEIARAEFPGTTTRRAPLDFAPCVRRALRGVQPRLLVLECLEVWPSWMRACEDAGVPVAVVNGRLSVASFRRYRWARPLFAPCFRSLKLVGALTEEDAERFVALGTRPEVVFVEGSSKHASLHLASAPPREDDPPVLVLGSVHREEEALLFPQLRSLFAACPRLRLVVAPRYPHRAPSTVRALRRAGLRAELESSVASRGGESPLAACALVLDRMGTLPRYYQGARAAFVGGSLVPRGGHNVLEPAAAGAAVLTGPHTAHCARELEALVAAGAAQSLARPEEFGDRAARWLGDLGARVRAEAAQRTVLSFQGAALRTARRLEELLS